MSPQLHIITPVVPSTRVFLPIFSGKVPHPSAPQEVALLLERLLQVGLFIAAETLMRQQIKGLPKEPLHSPLGEASLSPTPLISAQRDSWEQPRQGTDVPGAFSLPGAPQAPGAVIPFAPLTGQVLMEKMRPQKEVKSYKNSGRKKSLVLSHQWRSCLDSFLSGPQSQRSGDEVDSSSQAPSQTLGLLPREAGRVGS